MTEPGLYIVPVSLTVKARNPETAIQIARAAIKSRNVVEVGVASAERLDDKSADRVRLRVARSRKP